MSRNMMKVALAGALLVSALAGAAAATANWTSNGPGTTTFTAGSDTFIVHSSGSGALGINCGSSTAVVDTGSSGTSLTLSITSQTFSTCSIAGQTFAVKCTQNVSIEATAYSPALSATHGDVANIDCIMVKLSGACGNATTYTGGGFTLAGPMTATYGNTSRALTLTSKAPSPSLRASWSSTGCLQGTGTGTATVTVDFRYSYSSGLVPQITN